MQNLWDGSMTLLKFTIDKTCSDSGECAENILNKIEILTNSLRTYDEKGKLVSCSGHLSISHESYNHTVFLFLYEKDHEHQSEDIVSKTIRKEKFDKVKKYSGIIPTVEQIKNLL
jgi:hypothetical protein